MQRNQRGRGQQHRELLRAPVQSDIHRYGDDAVSGSDRHGMQFLLLFNLSQSCPIGETGAKKYQRSKGRLNIFNMGITDHGALPTTR